MPNPLSVTFQDEDNDVATHRYHVRENIVTTDNIDLQAWLATIPGISNAGVPKFGLLSDLAQTDATEANAYDSEDKMVLSFRDVFGNITRLPIPAPLRTLMQPNDEEFEPKDINPIIDELVTQVLLYVVSKGADALIEYIKSKRSRRNRS